jgi:hypothetical protein
MAASTEVLLFVVVVMAVVPDHQYSIKASYPLNRMSSLKINYFDYISLN